MHIVESVRVRTAVLSLAGYAALTVLVACAGAPGTPSTGAKTGSVLSPTAAAMSPGMVMPDGSTMGAGPTDAAARTSGSGHPPPGPSHTASMVCEAEVGGDIATILNLKPQPVGLARWANDTYTCTYRLVIGPLVLSVHQSPGDAAAKRYAAEMRRTLPDAHTLDGLTTTAFGTATGKVVLVKDSDTLTVDATGLPEQFGSQQQKRSDFAYELASDILGCWTGDS